MIDDEENEARDQVVADLIPPHWNLVPYEWAKKIRDLTSLLPGVKVTGSGTSVDTADFSFEADGKHYWVFIREVGGKPL